MVLPLVSIGVLTAAVLAPGTLGQNLQALYLTWSPYHYAAQAYGLAAYVLPIARASPPGTF